MKRFYPTFITTFTLVLLTACSQSKPDAPSENSALHSISPTKEKTDGWMQNGLDSWLKDDWEPTISKDEKVQEKYMEAKIITDTSCSSEKVKFVERDDKGFTLQEYYDKAEAYFKAQERDYENSHVEKLNKMPVIGSEN
ncbi:MAG: hypothetical protein JXQ67_04050 [Campylobacterales bacterium]|nr:hypothetical protein [Campylobacterales bacterium]